MTPSPAPYRTVVDVSDGPPDLATLIFLRESESRAHRHFVTRDVTTSPELTRLPAHDLLLSLDGDPGGDVVLVLDGVVAWLRSWRSGGRLHVCGPDAVSARKVTDLLLEAVAEPELPGQVEVEFADARLGSRHLALDVQAWTDVERLYPAQVATAISALVGHQQQPDDPRLLLWHGRPGTGKTTAIRALLDAWRDWTTPVVVSDPESLMGDGRYLRRILLDADDDQTWRLLVLEDAEALMQVRGGGRAVGTLLNLADGLLGQGLRCLFLLTTNQTLEQVHPALLRPGRCLSLLEFGALSAAEAAVLRGGPVARSMTLAEAMSREVEQVGDPVELGGYL
jgi:hypothetical protein